MSESSLRIVWFGQSIISDWNNPIATTARATMRAIQNAGHTVAFLEPRNSPAFVSALAARGWAPYRDFQEHFSDLHYRTYDMPRRAERDVWLSREAALVDAVIVQSDSPPEIFEWLERVPDAPMTRVMIAIDRTVTVPDVFDLVLAPGEFGIGQSFGPAVLPPNDLANPDRSGTIVACYSAFEMDSIPASLIEEPLSVVAVGASAPVELPYISESAIVEHYRNAKNVVVIDDDPSPLAVARPMLAVAAGARVARIDSNRTIYPVLSYEDARGQMIRLVSLIRDARESRRDRAGKAPNLS